MQNETSYSEAIKLKYPESIVIAIAKDPRGKCNPISLGWWMVTSGSPPMMAVSIGRSRYSLEAFRHAGEFVVAFPSAEQGDEVLFYGSRSGRDCDKLAEFGAKTQPAKKIDCLLLADAVANFECKLVGETPTGDHVIFVGEVICSHTNERVLERIYSVAPGHVLGALPRGKRG